MRKALGLLGESPRHRPESERSEQPNRGSDRFNGGLHRRRFVQDGDVPVTVLRREPGQEAPAHRSVAAIATPTSSRLQRTEAALAVETAGREKAERLLAEAQAVARDLQTKIGHAELTKNEAIGALRQEREVSAALRAEVEALTARVDETRARAEAADQAIQEHQSVLADERHARKVLEKALHAAEVGRDAAERLARTLSEDLPDRADNAVPTRRSAGAEPEVIAAKVKRGRPSTSAVQDAEPEPVKWWLAPSKSMAKRK
ncbi:hypothetical protein [Rhodopila sp.]|uniref:hypothetical protein n=1 Tax=Rhodopila sp. TaxID=2480087 RepID=UPI003D0B03E7